MPSPFEDPASSVDLDDDGDEEEGQGLLDPNPSTISSELDLSIANPVSICLAPATVRLPQKQRLCQ